MRWTGFPTADEGARPAVAMADGLALVAFVLVGVMNHDGVVTLGLVARTAIPLLAAWYAFGAVLGAYRRPGLRTLLSTWIAAVPTAVVVRSLIARGPWGVDLFVFLGVALAFTLTFVLAVRLLVGAVTGARAGAR